MTFDEKKARLAEIKSLPNFNLDSPPARVWLVEELEKAWAALAWYADPKNHEIDDANGYYPEASYPIGEDEGKRAREALNE